MSVKEEGGLMLRRKRIVAGILVAGMTFAMAGCGKKDEGKTEEKDSVSTSGSATEEMTVTEEPGEEVILEDDAPYFHEADMEDIQDGQDVLRIDFDNNSEDGFVTYTNGGSCNIKAVNKELAVKILNVGTLDYANQIFHDGFQLSQDCVYNYKFDVRCDIERTIEWRLQMNGGDYHAYAGEYIQIGPEVTTIDVDIKMNEPSDPAPRLVFNLGKMEDMNENPEEHTIYFDNIELGIKDAEKAQKIEAVPVPPRMNTSQIGYKTEDKKTVTIASEKINTFYVINAETGEEVYQGKYNDPIDSKATGNILRQGDFSEVKTKGRYYIQSGDYKTYEFTIDDDVYKDPYKDVVKMLYLQRCGCEVTKEIAGDFAHGPCHTQVAKVFGTDEEKDVSGGWHDAGDYGRYVVAGAKTIEDLLIAYENGEEADDYGIPESGNGVPDLLDEARYELEWMLKMQDEKSGGVYHKVTGLGFPDTVLAVDETQELYLAPISYAATGDFVAVMSDASRLYEKYDKDFAAKCLAAAEKAWTYIDDGKLEKHRGYTNPKEIVTGEYSDGKISDEQFWGAVSLYRATKDEKYKKAVRDFYKENLQMGLGWADMGTYAFYALLKTDPDDIEDIVEKGREAILMRAEEIYQLASQSGFNVALDTDYPWGSNMSVANDGMLLMMAAEINGSDDSADKYMELAKKQLDYLLGNNALGYCFVTGYGTVSPIHPHHRPSQVLGKSMKGMLVGGPNSNREDTYAMAVLKDIPPALCYADNEQAYSLNEIAIYWNSPLICLMSAFK